MLVGYLFHSPCYYRFAFEFVLHSMTLATQYFFFYLCLQRWYGNLV